MKIAYIGQKGIPAKIGGAEKYVEEVAVRMAQKGHEVFVYVRNYYTEKDLTEYKGVKLIHLPTFKTKNLDAISHTFLATFHALFQDYDIVHYSMIGPTSLSFVIKIFKRKTVLISTFQCQDYYHQKWSWMAKFYLRFGEWITCRVPDITIVVSKKLMHYVQSKYNRNSVYIPNGARSADAFHSDKEFTNEWGLNRKDYILSVSRLIRHKGIHHLIQAFKNVERKGLTRGKKLVIVGDGFYTDAYVKYVKNLAGNISDIIFTGAQSGKELDKLFSNCYFFVQPSESEGLSLALLEAMGYGKAVLVSGIPENLEAIGDSGIIFKNKSVSDLENKIIELINEPNLVNVYGGKARIRISNNYDWREISDRIEELYLNNLSLKIHGKSYAV